MRICKETKDATIAHQERVEWTMNIIDTSEIK